MFCEKFAFQINKNWHKSRRRSSIYLRIILATGTCPKKCTSKVRLVSVDINITIRLHAFVDGMWITVFETIINFFGTYIRIDDDFHDILLYREIIREN